MIVIGRRLAIGRRLVLNESELIEKFIAGGTGNGGQALNKTSNTVQLTHIPTGLVVKCKHTRYLERNREIARQILADRVEHHLDPLNSRISRMEETIRRKKIRMHQRSRKKHSTVARVSSAKQ